MIECDLTTIHEVVKPPLLRSTKFGSKPLFVRALIFSTSLLRTYSMNALRFDYKHTNTIELRFHVPLDTKTDHFRDVLPNQSLK